MEIYIKFTLPEIEKAINSGKLQDLAATIKTDIGTQDDPETIPDNWKPDKQQGPANKAEETAPAQETEQENPEITLEQLRAMLAAITKADRKDEVKALLASVGANKLTEVPPAKYAILWAAAGGDKQ